MAELVTMTELSTTVLARLTTIFAAAADPERSEAMSAYMRSQFPFLGIQSPAQRLLTRDVLAGLPRPTEDDLRAVAVACWHLPEREYQYFACAWLRRHARICGPGFVTGTAHTLITTKSWWDTVDTLASHTVGPIVARHPGLLSTMDSWVLDGNIWVARTAILHQLHYKEATDAQRLFHYCTARAGHPDFFIRKAIGWALREYGKTDPEAVRGYVTANRSRLSALSVREALKNVG